jgi:hypothetical protein
MKPTTKNSPAIKTGNARDNKPAEAYEANGAGVSNSNEISMPVFTNKKSAYEILRKDPAATVSMGYNGDNANGSWDYRGAGAATKGLKNYGPKA